MFAAIVNRPGGPVIDSGFGNPDCFNAAQVVSGPLLAGPELEFDPFVGSPQFRVNPLAKFTERLAGPTAPQPGGAHKCPEYIGNSNDDFGGTDYKQQETLQHGRRDDHGTVAQSAAERRKENGQLPGPGRFLGITRRHLGGKQM